MRCPLEQELWEGLFPLDDPPLFPCPHCSKARLALEEAGTHQEEPQYSKALRKDADWDPEWITQRVALRLKCTDKKCGEVVFVSGEIVFSDVIDDDGDWSVEERFVPRSMVPAPPIIAIPGEVPRTVSVHVESAFELYWVDLGASANRLRTSVEVLLDDFKIPREGKRKNGKTYRLSLEARAEAFKLIDSDHATTFDALRVVGNLGSHGEVYRQPLLDAFAIYEDALRELYGKHKQKIAALRKKIIAKSGSY